MVDADSRLWATVGRVPRDCRCTVRRSDTLDGGTHLAPSVGAHLGDAQRSRSCRHSRQIAQSRRCRVDTARRASAADRDGGASHQTNLVCVSIVRHVRRRVHMRVTHQLNFLLSCLHCVIFIFLCRGTSRIDMPGLQNDVFHIVSQLFQASTTQFLYRNIAIDLLAGLVANFGVRCCCCCWCVRVVLLWVYSTFVQCRRPVLNAGGENAASSATRMNQSIEFHNAARQMFEQGLFCWCFSSSFNLSYIVKTKRSLVGSVCNNTQWIALFNSRKKKKRRSIANFSKKIYIVIVFRKYTSHAAIVRRWRYEWIRKRKHSILWSMSRSVDASSFSHRAFIYTYKSRRRHDFFVIMLRLAPRG